MEQLDFSFPIFNFPQIFKNRFFFLKLYTPGNVRTHVNNYDIRTEQLERNNKFVI